MSNYLKIYIAQQNIIIYNSIVKHKNMYFLIILKTFIIYFYLCILEVKIYFKNANEVANEKKA